MGTPDFVIFPSKIPPFLRTLTFESDLLDRERHLQRPVGWHGITEGEVLGPCGDHRGTRRRFGDEGRTVRCWVERGRRPTGDRIPCWGTPQRWPHPSSINSSDRLQSREVRVRNGDDGFWDERVESVEGGDAIGGLGEPRSGVGGRSGKGRRPRPRRHRQRLLHRRSWQSRTSPFPFDSILGFHRTRYRPPKGAAFGVVVGYVVISLCALVRSFSRRGS